MQLTEDTEVCTEPNTGKKERQEDLHRPSRVLWETEAVKLSIIGKSLFEAIRLVEQAHKLSLVIVSISS